MDKDIKNEFEKIGERTNDILSAINKFAGSVDKQFEKIESEMATKSELNSLKTDIKDLKERAFTVKEKEEVLAMVRTHDKQLENDILGRETITLTRPEYDKTAESAGFSNRFESEVA